MAEVATAAGDVPFFDEGEGAWQCEGLPFCSPSLLCRTPAARRLLRARRPGLLAAVRVRGVCFPGKLTLAPRGARFGSPKQHLGSPWAHFASSIGSLPQHKRANTTNAQPPLPPHLTTSTHTTAPLPTAATTLPSSDHQHTSFAKKKATCLQRFFFCSSALMERGFLKVSVSFFNLSGPCGWWLLT